MKSVRVSLEFDSSGFISGLGLDLGLMIKLSGNVLTAKEAGESQKRRSCQLYLINVKKNFVTRLFCLTW